MSDALTMADIVRARREGRNEGVGLMKAAISAQQSRDDGRYLLKGFSDEQLETVRTFVSSFEK